MSVSVQQDVLRLVDATLSDGDWCRLEVRSSASAAPSHASADEIRLDSVLHGLVNFRTRTLLGWMSFRETSPVHGGDVGTPPPIVPVAQHGPSLFTGGLDEPGAEPMRVPGFASSAVAPVYWLRGAGESSRGARRGLESSENDLAVDPEGEEVSWYEAWIDPKQAIARSPDEERAAVRQSFVEAGLSLDKKLRVGVATTHDARRMVRVELSLPTPQSRPAAAWRLRFMPGPSISGDVGAALADRPVREVVEEFVGPAT